jgi:hypothetical protein
VWRDWGACAYSDEDGVRYVEEVNIWREGGKGVINVGERTCAGAVEVKIGGMGGGECGVKSDGTGNVDRSIRGEGF